MSLALNQPCFIETSSRDIIIAKARIVELSESGGALLCESGEHLPSERQAAVLVAITGHRLQRIPVTLTTHSSDRSTVSFWRA